MAPKANPNEEILTLPISVVTKIDVNRMRRELEAVDNFLSQSAIREPGISTKLPKTSRLLDELVMINNLNVLHEEDRRRLVNFLLEVYAKAPQLHMSFSADPSPLFMQRLTTWLRDEIHPLVLVQVGMQPNIGAGCIVRSTNKYFDFSLRQRFTERRDILAHRLKGFEA